jgi:hypothetical protein
METPTMLSPVRKAVSPVFVATLAAACLPTGAACARSKAVGCKADLTNPTVSVTFR